MPGVGARPRVRRLRIGESMLVQFWEHNKPLPEGAVQTEGAVIDHHHRAHASIVELGDEC